MAPDLASSASQMNESGSRLEIASRPTQGGGLQPGHFIPGSTVELATSTALEHAAPLLEKKRHLGTPALIAYRRDPASLHRSRTVTAFTADDDPTDSLQREP